MKTTKLNRVVKDGNGYAAGVRCGLNHSGNHLLAGPTNGYWQCSGCGEFFGADAISATQKESGSGWRDWPRRINRPRLTPVMGV